jgi:hypothetical protein
MVNLNGHETGNGGYRQGELTAHQDLLYSEANPLRFEQEMIRAASGRRKWLRKRSRCYPYSYSQLGSGPLLKFKCAIGPDLFP